MGNLLRVDQIPAGQLAIFAFSPTHGAPGVHVVVSGQGFSTTIASDVVTFNGVTAVVTAATATQLTATVPSGATTGKISVTVGTQSATSDDVFVVDTTGLAPTISSVAPLLGAAGTTVTVTGAHLDPVSNETSAAINGWKTAPSSATNAQVQFAVPSTDGSGKVSITTPYGMATSTTDFAVVPPGISVGAVANTQRMVVGGQASISIPAGNYGAILFDATAGAWLSFQISRLSSGSATVHYTVYDTQNRLVASGVIQSVDLSIHLPQLKVAGTYSIWITPNTAPASMTLALGTDQVVSLNKVTSLSLPTSYQNARLIFTGTAAQTVALEVSNVTITPSSDTASYQVILPSGAATGTVYEYGATTINLPNLPMTGTYQLLVYPGGSATLSAQLELLSGITGTLSSNGTTKQFSSAPGQNVYLSFTAATAGNYGLGLSGLTSTPDHYVNVNVYNASNSLVSSNINCLVSNGGCGLDMQSLAAGAYQVIVSPPGSDTMTFSATLSRDLTGTLPLNTPKSITLVSGQTGTMTFTATAGQTLVLQASSATTTPANQSVVYSIYAPNGNLYSKFTQYAGESAAFNLANLSATGTYKVYVVPNFGAALTEQLELLPGSVGTLSINGASQSYSTIVPGQFVYLNFTASPGDNLGLGITALTISPNNGGAVPIYVYDANNNLVGSNVNCLPANGGCSLALQNLAGGAYQIIVMPQSGQTVNFTATLTRDLTGTLSLNTPESVNLTSPGQAGELTFAGTVGQVLALQASSVTTTPAGALVSYNVYNPDGSLYSSFNSVGNVQGNMPYAPQTGTYSVNIVGADGATLSEQLALVTPITGTLTIGGAGQNYATTIPGAGVYLNFTAAAGDNLNLVISNFGAYPDYQALLLVFDANNNQITGNNCQGGTGCTLSLTNLAAGTYQVRMAPYSGEYDTMTFTATLSRQ